MSQLCRFERHVDIESYSLTCHVSYVHHALCRTCRSHRHLTAPQWPHSQPTCLTRSALFTAPPVLLYPKWLICEIQTKLKTNLQAGRLRMVFVADEIPSELQRIVEFLNGQLTTAEVLAVEVKQYVGQGVRTLVPRVIGLTSEAERSKSTGRGARRTGDETSFFQDLSARQGPDAAANEEAITAIYEWCRDKQLSFRWGWRGVQGNVYVGVPQSGKTHYIFSMWSGGGMVIEFGYLKKEPPFDDEMKRIEFLRQLNEIPGIALPDSAIQRYAHVPVSPFHNEAGRSQFLRAIDWAVKGIQST